MITPKDTLAQIIHDAIGPNGPYPTPQELAAHALRQVRAEPESRIRVEIPNASELTRSDSLHIVAPQVVRHTLDESTIDSSIDLGRGVVLHFGQRGGIPVVILENYSGALGAVWHDA